MQIFIKIYYYKTITIDCNKNLTIKKLKYLIYKKTKKKNFPVYSSQQKLRLGNKYLINFHKYSNKITTLNFYNIQNEMTIYCDYNWHSLHCRCNNCKNYICLRSGKRITKL